MTTDRPMLRARTSDYEYAPADERRNARVPVKQAAAGRVCADPTCSTILRRSNADDKCSVHRPVATAHLPLTHRGTLTERLLAAMPGTARELAERTGGSLQSVRATCGTLVRDGRAESFTAERVGFLQVERTVFHRAPRQDAA